MNNKKNLLGLIAAFVVDFNLIMTMTSNIAVVNAHAHVDNIVATPLDIEMSDEMSDYFNVYGEELKSCSTAGMAMTGFTGTGTCIETDDDFGSHHICIDLSSLGGNDPDNYQNFCEVTEQSDWCSEENIQNWCVCQWAFSAYVAKAGCDNIQEVKCDSTNKEALLAYEKDLADPEIKGALDCLKDKCGLD